MGSLTLLGVAVLAISYLSVTVTAQGFGLGSSLSLGRLGTFGTGFNFLPGNSAESSTAASSEDGNVGINSNLGLGKLGSFGSGFNFKPGSRLQKTSPGSTTAVTPAGTTDGITSTSTSTSTSASTTTSTSDENVGLNTNLGLGKVGSLGSGINFKPGSKLQTTSPAAVSQTTTTVARANDESIGLNTNLGLGKAGSLGSGINFKPGSKLQTTSPAGISSAAPAKGLGTSEDSSAEEENVGLNSNLGLGKIGSLGSGINFKPGSKLQTTSPASDTATSPAARADENIGLNTNLGLGKVGSLGSGINFKPGSKLQSTTARSRPTLFTRSTTPATTRTTGVQDNVGLNSKLGLGKAGSLGSGVNFKPGSRLQSTTPRSRATPSTPSAAIANSEENVGLNSNLGLGKVGSVGSGINFKPGSKLQTTTEGTSISPSTTTVTTPSDSNDVNTPKGARTSRATITPGVNGNSEHVKDENIGLNSNLGLGKVGSLGSGINFRPGSKLQSTTARSRPTPFTRSTTPVTTRTTAGGQDNIGSNSNLGLGKVGSIRGGIGFQPGSKLQTTSPANDAAITSSSPAGEQAKDENIGLNSNLGLGKVSSVGSGINFKPGSRLQSTTRARGTPITPSTPASRKEENIGLNSNLGLGKAGSIGSGINFKPGSKLQSTTARSSPTLFTRSTTPATTSTASEQGNVGSNSNLGLGKAGSLGGGANFKPGSAAGSKPTGATRNNIGLNTNLGLGKVGSVGSGINFKPGGGAESTPTPATVQG